MKKRPTFAMDDCAAVYLIEVKVKSHNSEMWQRIQNDLLLDDVVSSEESLLRRDAVDSVLKHAADQIDATATAESDFRIVWLSFDGHDQDLRWNQVLATFYGIVYTLPRHGSTTSADHCYYFDYSTAYSCPKIDALVISDGRHLQVCLNNFSPRYEAIKLTGIVAELQSRNGVIDPPKLAEDGIALVLRSNVSRRNEIDVVRALQQQEGIEVTPIRMKRHSAYASVGPKP